MITSKLGDHLPLYRLERISARHEVHIARSTMCAWVRAAGESVTPLVELTTDRVRRLQAIHKDDTTVPIQSPGAKPDEQSDHLRPGTRSDARRHQWAALCVYTAQGFLAIDNNAAERALKRVALGRKNWLFAGNDDAAASHAKLWSLIASCERHGIDPQRYLTSVLAKIRTTPGDELDQFLPDAWKAGDAAEPEPSAS